MPTLFSGPGGASLPGSFHLGTGKENSAQRLRLRRHRQLAESARFRVIAATAALRQSGFNHINDPLRRRIITLRFCAVFLRTRRNNSARPSGPARIRSRTGNVRCARRSFLASSTAASSKIVCGTTSSTSPALSACLARSCLPVRIISSAVLTPTSRGSRCVPPDPGKSPNCTSGSPRTVLTSSVQIRRWQASAISRPPPRQAP